MRARRNKKGSLNLSVNAIVILVMAITMLGLGLGFIRDKFGGAGNLIDDVQQKVKDQIIEDFTTGPAKISFPKTTFEIETGGEELIAAGVKNNEEGPRSFAVEFYAMNEDTCYATGGDGEENNCGGADFEPTEILPAYELSEEFPLTLEFIKSYKSVSVNDYRIMAMKIFAQYDETYLQSGNTFFIRMKVCKETIDSEDGTCDEDEETYANKEFFIEII